jgi:NAD(P)-dependent dehydrogenase (short-subunit alcohol dehydrogenase family)
VRTLEDAVVVITGASRGIGRGIAEELGRGGARVVVNYRANKEAADEVVERLLTHGAKAAVAVQADVSDPDQAARLIDEAIKRFGRIDLLVNNAGINIDRSLRHMSVEDWRCVIERDLSSQFYTTRAAISHYIDQHSGAIINMSSVAGLVGNFGQANYAAAKAGILGLTKASALELARYNVTVNAICAGPVDTPMWEAVPAEAKAAILKRIPLNRVATIQEVARAVRFLYEDGEYFTGEAMNLTGGWVMA